MPRALRFTILAAALAAPFGAGAQAPLSQTPTQTQEECQRQLREYRASVECFGRFRTAKGGVRPEAFQHCKEVKQPAGCHYTETSAPPTRYIPPATDRNYPEPAKPR